MENHQHITSKHNTDQSKTQHNGQLSVLKTCSRRMAQIEKKKKNGRPGLEKGTLQKTLFTSVLTITREIPQKNQRKKSWQDVSVNRFENIPTVTETMIQKFSIYLLGMSNHVKLVFKTSQYPFVASLCWYVYIKKNNKITWFCKIKFLC